MNLNEGIWLLPVRGRPEGLARLVRSIEENDPGARVVAFLDRDDPDYKNLVRELPGRWEFWTTPGWESVLEKLNGGILEYPNEGFYGFLANDVEICTKGTLEELARICPEWGMSYCDDGIRGITLPTHPCMGGKLISALGWFGYPEAAHNGMEIYLQDVALSVGAVAYTKLVRMRHSHPIAKTRTFDAVDERVKGWQERDNRANQLWLERDRDLTIARVLEVRNG